LTDFTPIIGSSVIKDVAHDPVTNTLKVRFTSGKEYHYPGCGPEHFKALTDLNGREGSAGKYFNTHIAGKFGARKT
jgi:KTSC domain